MDLHELRFGHLGHRLEAKVPSSLDLVRIGHFQQICPKIAGQVRAAFGCMGETALMGRLSFPITSGKQRTSSSPSVPV